MTDQPAAQHLTDAPGAPIRILTDDGWQTLAPPTARVLVPGAYLDAYRAADRHQAATDALHDLLDAAETIGEGHNRRALLDVPTDLLPALTAVALDHFSTWGDDYTRRRTTLPREEAETLRTAARAAFVVHQQAKTAQERPR